MARATTLASPAAVRSLFVFYLVVSKTVSAWRVMQSSQSSRIGADQNELFSGSDVFSPKWCSMSKARIGGTFSASPFASASRAGWGASMPCRKNSVNVV